MKITDVVTATTLDKMYIDFIPSFIQSWKTLFPSINIHIILIAFKIPDRFVHYKEYIHLFEPINNVSNSFVSQFIRLLFPGICYTAKEGILITDIDMIPLNSSYFKDNIEGIEKNRFISYRSPFMWNNAMNFPICYNLAIRKTWSEIFNVQSLYDIKKRLSDEYKKINYDGSHGGKGWYTDQIVLYNCLMRWYHKNPRIIILGDSLQKFNRLDRKFNFKLTKKLNKNIKLGVYSDYHMCRPYSTYKLLNDSIINEIIKN